MKNTELTKGVIGLFCLIMLAAVVMTQTSSSPQTKQTAGAPDNK